MGKIKLDGLEYMIIIHVIAAHDLRSPRAKVSPSEVMKIPHLRPSQTKWKHSFETLLMLEVTMGIKSIRKLTFALGPCCKPCNILLFLTRTYFAHLVREAPSIAHHWEHTVYEALCYLIPDDFSVNQVIQAQPG